jgi:Arc/MetJ-type ribon-helix-helix transcriptional regulator
MQGESTGGEPRNLDTQVLEQLREQGIDLTSLACCTDDDGSPVRVVCVAASVGEALDAMGKFTRDQVVMVRVDQETVRKLDAWVETGAVKSRSEAAALFIREGLELRDQELEELGDAIDAVERAKEQLRKRVREVLGRDG